MPFLKLFISLSLALCSLSSKAQTFNSSVNLSGKYEMQIQINDKIFIDYLKIGCNFSWNNPCFGLYLEPQNTSLRGSLEVPNVFIAPIKSGFLDISENPRSALIEFEILAEENGQEFKVYYKAEIPSELYQDILDEKLPPTFKGSALLENNKLLGHFKAVKIE